MSLSSLSRQLTVYGGWFLFSTGIIGNGLNILVFSSVRIYHKTPSSFYFLVASILNGLYILIILLARILSVGYGYDLTRTSMIWCKLRQYLIGCLGLTSFSCTCLSIIDQYMITSKHVSLRRYSNIKWAHRIVFVFIILWCLHGIPSLIYYNISPMTNTCINVNNVYQEYLLVNAPLFLCALPVLIGVLFGYLTYRNIRQTIVLAGEHADRQLVRMSLMQVFLIVISITPPGIFTVYTMLTNEIVKDSDRQMKEAFAGTVIGLTSYLYYAANFYIFFLSSSRFRRRVKERIFRWQRQNRIHHFQT